MTEKTLYPFQDITITTLLSQPSRHIVISSTGSGKTVMAVKWAYGKIKATNKKKVLVVTTASKANMVPNDFDHDCDEWNGEEFRARLEDWQVVSWHKLKRWTDEHASHLSEYIYVFDEIAKAGAGVSSGMGRSFLRIASQTNDWTGFTATPGDTWIKFYPYFQATGKIKNKTEFRRDYCNERTYKGFPEIVGYYHEDRLKRWWGEISIAVDTSQMMKELPKETHRVITYKKPSTYKKTKETLIAPDGTFLETTGALCAELRRQCFTKDKKAWIKDFIENNDDGAVFFYNFVKTGDEIEKIIDKALDEKHKGPKYIYRPRIWRIDGAHHDIPTTDTYHKGDIVIAQYQSGSEALNLQFIHYWVAVELCYSYSTAVQARGRVKRIGQKHPMLYVYLMTQGTIEQAILKCLRNKSDFAEDVWAEGIIEQ